MSVIRLWSVHRFGMRTLLPLSCVYCAIGQDMNRLKFTPTEVLKTIYDANGTIDANNKQSLTASIQKRAGIAV